MPSTSSPFAPPDSSHTLTAAKIAFMVKFCREMRSWSQEALAAEAGITARTLQRVEAGQPSDVQTRRALARAFGALDIDVFNKPLQFLSLEQMVENQRQEEEERKRLYLELPTTIATGAGIVEMATRAEFCTFALASDTEVPKAAEQLVATLEDYFRDTLDIANEVGAVSRLAMAAEIDAFLRDLAYAGMTIALAEEDTQIKLDGGHLMKVTIGHLAVCTKNKMPAHLLVPRSLRVRT